MKKIILVSVLIIASLAGFSQKDTKQKSDSATQFTPLLSFNDLMQIEKLLDNQLLGKDVKIVMGVLKEAIKQRGNEHNKKISEKPKSTN